MKKIVVHFLCLSSLFQVPAFAGIETTDKHKTCILNFERRIHPFTQVLHSVFDPAIKKEEAILIDEALPVELMSCVDQGATEIIIVAHAGDLNREKKRKIPAIAPKAALCYFKELKGKDRDQAISSTLERLTLLQKTSTEAKAAVNKQHGAENLVFSDNERRQLAIQKKIQKKVDQIHDLTDDMPIYAPPKIILPLVFESLVEKLRSEKKQTGVIRLKKIRFLSCMPTGVKNRYVAQFNDLSGKDLGIQLEFAPVSTLASLILGVNEAVSFSKRDWLEKSLR